MRVIARCIHARNRVTSSEFYYGIVWENFDAVSMWLNHDESGEIELKGANRTINVHGISCLLLSMAFNSYRERQRCNHLKSSQKNI